jgi:signal-transduction protein with cAMP-binding, CBS, and nucleotidyltransferase domain
MAGTTDRRDDPTPGRPSDVTQVRAAILYRALEEEGFADAHLGKANPRLLAGILAEVPLFSRLSSRHLRRIADVAQVARVSGGQVIVREGFSAEGFYVLLTGSATVSQEGTRFRKLQRGDFFGELGLLDGAPRTATVTAETEGWVMKLSRQAFSDLLDREPAIARRLLETLAGRTRRVEHEGKPWRHG